MKHTLLYLRRLCLEKLLCTGLAVAILLVSGEVYSQARSNDPTEWRLSELSNYRIPHLAKLNAGYSQPQSNDPTEWRLSELSNYRVPRLAKLDAGYSQPQSNDPT